MQALIGHAVSGLGFVGIGLWYLYNHIKLHSIDPGSYISRPWFPASKIKYLELIFIVLGSFLSTSLELFIRTGCDQVLDPDGTILPYHLHNFEHSLIAVSLFAYTAFAIILNRSTLPESARSSLSQLVGVTAFGQECLLFWFHSADHADIEHQYHLLFQVIIFVSFSTTLIGIGLEKSFLTSFARSWSIFFRGFWLMMMGFMLSCPRLIPKGCYLHSEECHEVVRCYSDEALSLGSIQFSFFLILTMTFAMFSYSFFANFFAGKRRNIDIRSLIRDEDV